MPAPAPALCPRRGSFGYQLPLAWHAAVQGAHVALAAWRVAPPLCAAAAPLRLPGNSGRLQALALALDWPLRAMGAPPLLMPGPGACLALVAWTQVVAAFVLPTALLCELRRRSMRRSQAAARAKPVVSNGGGGGESAGASTPAPSGAAAARARLRPAGGDSPLADEWRPLDLGLFAAQLAWLLLRVALHDAGS